MNDFQEFANPIIGSSSKTVLRTTPKVPTFTVKTVEKLVAKIDYSAYESAKNSNFDEIIDIVKKSANLPTYNKIVGDYTTRTIGLYRKETIVIL